ncbi:glycoside hydrolase family 88 protein [Bacillales bacterium AN1005]|uniref:glycoside hydrolase family 88 protein n=1 Tax=Niallia taxi TaxID=2499688 RepID=UPI002E22CF3F|nr:glycoside hydrolase family 88 protein [Niallia taxi]
MKSIDEGIKHNNFKIRTELNKEWLDKEIQFVLRKIDENLDIFKTKVPPAVSKNLVYIPEENTDWTASFWIGMLYLAYEYTNDDKYLQVIKIQLESFKDRLTKNIQLETHDIGFLYSLSSVAGYEVLNDNTAKETAIKAADKLMTRYHKKAKILQAWGDLSDPEQHGRMIIDCNMNLPLLYFASKVTGDKKYYDIAANHAEQAAKYIVRADSSTYHTFYMDTETGNPLYGKTAQGYTDQSCWARGQAWGVYGFVLSYVHTGNREFLDLSERLANYFLNRLPEDAICYWDLVFTDGSEERDSSAAAIMACGLLELSKHLPISNPYRELYENAAIKMIKSLAANYTTKEVPSNGILQHAVYSKPDDNGVDECCIWGDYYYFEALIRTAMSWKMYW